MLAFNSKNIHDYYNLNHGYYCSHIQHKGLEFALSVILSDLRKDYVFCKKTNKRLKNEFVDKKTQESYNLLMWKIKNGSQENIRSDKRYFEIRKTIFAQYEYLKLGKITKYYLESKRYFDSFFDSKEDSEVYHTCKNNIVIHTHRFDYPILTGCTIVTNSIIKKYSDIYIDWIIKNKISECKILEKFNPYNINFDYIGISKGEDFFSKIVKLCNLMQRGIDNKTFIYITKTEKLDKYFK